MFNFVPTRYVPGFRVGVPESTLGFRVAADGSWLGDHPTMPIAIAFGGLLARRKPDPLVGWPTDGPLAARPSGPEWAAVRPLPCATAHRACIDSGRPAELCLRALYNCSQNGVPTIFAPGIWGAPS